LVKFDQFLGEHIDIEMVIEYHLKAEKIFTCWCLTFVIYMFICIVISDIYSFFFLQFYTNVFY